MQKIWRLAPKTESSVLHQVLVNRGIKTDDFACFLLPNWERDAYKPEEFTQMKAAVARVFEALANEEKIVIHGDYDADGVSGTTLLYSTIRDICKALEIPFLVEAFLPDREQDGYGVAMHTIDRLAGLSPEARSDGAKGDCRLLITVDCGIANGLELGHAQELGIDAIVCDHHQLGEHFPEQAIILHPLAPGETYPNKTLCGTGVAYKLACGLVAEARNLGADLAEGYEKWLLDLVALATVTDVMPLLGENRALEYFGLKVLQKTRRPGLKAIYNLAGIAPEVIDTQAIGYRIGPRLNAAGRLASAGLAFKTLAAETDEEALLHAAELERLNKERQTIFAESYKAAKLVAEPMVDKSSVLVVYSDVWLPGIVGLIAGKLVTEFGLPSFALAKAGSVIVGSGRSVGGLHLVQAMDACGDMFVKRGGHPQACGLTLDAEDKIDLFRGRVNEFAKSFFGEAGVVDPLLVDAEVPLADVTWDLYNALATCAPFGEGNRPAVFLAKNLLIRDVVPMGATESHLRLIVDEGGKTYKLVGFNFGHLLGALKIGDKVDVVYEVSVNEWNGNKDLQMRIVDLQIK